MHTDPYLWLEDDSAATRAWCAEQQARTAAQLDADPALWHRYLGV